MGEQVKELMDWARRRKVLAAVFVAFTLVVGILIGSIVSGRVSATKGFGFSGTTATALTVPDPIPASSSFAGIVNRVEPAVVNIATTQVLERKQSKKRRSQPYDQDDPMQDFFDRFFDGRQDGPPQAERSLGSGVIVDKRGYILTNNHVVEQATKIQVQLNGDTTRYTAKVVGVDEDTDLAVIKIDANKELPIAKLGNSDGVQVGDWVLAIGSPFGLQATVTAGIISAKARQIGQGPFDDFLQTDAAINPGNSGGPLVNMQGEVVGINTAIVAGRTGIGFAIPSNMARKIYTELIAKGKVTRGWLGVSIQPLTQELARSFNAKDTKGVLISDVVPDSPAAKAGLKAGDILIEFDGKKVEAPADLQRTVGLAQPGHDAKRKVWREQG